MGDSNNPVEAKLVLAATCIKAGMKKEDCQLLREVLVSDGQNLTAWEMLLNATDTTDEEVYCLNHILNLRPNHPWARQRLSAISSAAPYKINPQASEQTFPSKPSPHGTKPLPPIEPAKPGKPAQAIRPIKTRRRSRVLVPAAFALFVLVCASLTGITLNRAGILYRISPAGLTATAAAHSRAGCRDIIERAIQASGDYCSQIGAGKICYGNITLQAELHPNAAHPMTGLGSIPGGNALALTLNFANTPQTNEPGDNSIQVKFTNGSQVTGNNSTAGPLETLCKPTKPS